MIHNLDENENLRARIKQLELERNELQKDIEQLCMQQGGPSILGVATRMHFQRTASLEQEIESLKIKFAVCTREKHNLREELAEAYRVKAQLADLHAGEVAKNLEAEKQVRFFQGSVAAAFSERDKSVMEAEKAKENAEMMSNKLGEIEKRLEELSSDCLVQKRLNHTLQADLAKLEEQTRTYADVIEKFYDIRKASLCESLEMNVHEMCASLLDDPIESWTFNDPSTSEYVAALEGELRKVKNNVDNLQSKLQVGLDIENHLKKRVHALVKKNIVADSLIVNGITDMRHHHSQLRAYIMNLLNEEGQYIKLISKDLEEKLKLHSSEIENVVPLQHDLKPDESECRDVHITTVVKSCQVTKLEEPSFAKITAEIRADGSEAFAQALQEKVGALLLLSQQEERHLNEENVNAALQQKVDELQRSVLQVTNEKVRTLLELARVRQEYQSLKDKMSGTREGETPENRGRMVISNEKEGRLKNMWKKSYINRWIDPSSRESDLNTEADYAGNIDYARMKVEFAAMKESLESMGHLTTSIRRLRLALMEVKESNDTETTERRCEVAIANILVEATHLKTALGISIPISWSAESDMESVTDCESSYEKTDSVSAAGFEIGIGIYGAMAVAGRFICSVTGIDSSGGFDPSLDALLAGLGYATPPIMALLFILDDEVVKLSPHARAIRDVEDEELRSFFFGMSPWQFLLIVAASSIGEELFYRVAVQGALSDIFLRGTQLMTDTRGMASLTGVFPPFVPFAQAFAAVITATLTGSLYFFAASPKDPTYIVAPVLRSRRDDFKKLLSAWYEKRQMKKIYSPLLEGLLALYLGIEWVQTDNILAPMMTHGIYSAVILGHGLWKIHDHRRKLRRRIKLIRSTATDEL